MDFLSPADSDPTVVAQDLREQEILLDASGTPEPVLASTAQKDQNYRDVAGTGRMGQMSDVAGSYVEAASGGSDGSKRDSNGENDFQFLDFLKTNFSNSSASGRSFSPRSPSTGCPQQGSEDSSLSMLDLEAIPDPGSLVHVDSDVSLGSWLGDFMPEQCQDHPAGSCPVLPDQDDGKAENSVEISTEATPPPSEKQSDAEQSRIASLYLMSESQLGITQYSESPFGTPARSFGYPLREEPEGEASGSCEKQAPAVAQASLSGHDAFTLGYEDDKEVGTALDFFGTGYQGALGLQQEVFGSEQFTGDVAEVLAKDEEIFEDEHKLMMNSAEEIEDYTGPGFTTVAESQLMESPEHKISIGTYMAARSGKMGKLGDESTSSTIDRPSFGMKIKTPSPRKPYPLQKSERVDETFTTDGGSKPDENAGSAEISGDDCLDGTMTEDPAQHCFTFDHSDKTEVLEENVCDGEDQDTTLEPSLLSLSEAIMNMSTSVNNEELARAIIEISKKKKREKLSKAEKKSKSDQKENSKIQQREMSTSKTLGQIEAPKQSKRSSKIPVSAKSPSPPKPVRMSYHDSRHFVPKKDSTTRKTCVDVAANQLSQRGRSSSEKAQEGNAQRLSATRRRTDVEVAQIFQNEKPPPLQSVENVPLAVRDFRTAVDGGKEENTEPNALPVIVKDKVAEEIPKFSSEHVRTVPPETTEDSEKPANWNNIMQESFMQDPPEHDGDAAAEKSTSEQEGMPNFSTVRDSVFFPDEAGSRYILSSTRTDLSLMRGSLSRESIEELHRKLRVKGGRSTVADAGRRALLPLAENIEANTNSNFRGNALEILTADKKLEEDNPRKSRELGILESGGPAPQCSSPDRGTSRYSEEFHQMLPSMSFGEMATIQEHQFAMRDLEQEEGRVQRQDDRVTPKLDVIKEEEAEATQDTTLGGQSTSSGESQLPSEISHPVQHSTIRPQIPAMIPPGPPYPVGPHVIYRHPQSLPSGSLPVYARDMHYRQHVNGAAYHTFPADYPVHHAPAYPHSFAGYPFPANYAQRHHPAMHSTSVPLGFSVEQPSMASSAAAEMGLNYTTTSMYPQGYLQSGIVHAPRSAALDGRFPSIPESYCQSSQQAAISVPQELTFPGVRCVSLQSHAKLPIANKSDRWMQVELNIVSPAIDCWFSLDSKPLVGPHDTKNVEISFSPKKEGRFEALLEVSSCPVASTSQPIRPVSTIVNLKAVAENARAEFAGPDDSRIMNFGETLCESAKYLPLRIFNKSAADVPVCIILCTKSQDRRCFAISDSSNLEWADQEKRAQSILRTVVHPGDRPTTVWVHCKVPPKYCDAAEPPKSISAQVYMELDNSQKQSLDTIVLDTISVEVLACIAKLHAPKNMQPLNFSCSRENFQTHVLPVKNCGNVSSRVTFSLADHVDVFSIAPQHALLGAGEHVQVSIRFKPSRFTPERVNTTFLMKIEPNGTKYEVLIHAVCAEPELGRGLRQPFPDVTSHALSVADMPSLLTNKSHVCWGGVPVGHSTQQRVVLRTSNGARKPLPMRLMIKGEDAQCFQILKEDEKDREELCSKQEIMMLAGQDKVVRILFGPTKCKMGLAKLEIKAPVDQVPSTKFTIPLSGYGGKSEVRIEDLESLPREEESSCSLFCANAEIVGNDSTRLQFKFTVKNNLSRHAFVKATIYSDQACQAPYPAGSAHCLPSQFVLPKHNSRVLTVTLEKPPYTERSTCSRTGRRLAACVCLWHGDEIARHLLKNALAKLGPSAISKSLCDSNSLRGVPFDGIFEGEGSHPPEEDLSQVKPQIGDVQVFYTSMKKTTIRVFGPNFARTLSEMVEPGRRACEAASTEEQRRPTLATHLHYKRATQNDPSDDSWSLSPEHVILSVPRLNGVAEASKIKIINRSTSVLKFDVAWSAHYLTITPHSGQVDSESVLVMLLNANPSLTARRDLLPWLGTVQVSSQNGRGTKQLRVQIRDDVAPLDASAQLATPVPRLPLKARYSEMPSTDSFTTPLSASNASRVSGLTRDSTSQKVLLESATIDFGQASVKSSAKSHLEFTNVCPGSIRWLLTSFAPAYVKDIEPTGDLYRSTYAAFVFSHTSGLLEPGARIRIPVTFNPMSEGIYSQFWDLEHHEASDSAAMSLDKIRVQVTGQGVKSNRGTQSVSHTAPDKPKDGNGIYVSEDQVRFPNAAVNESAVVKIPVKNRSKESHNVRFVNVRPPFHITHQRHTIRPMSYACLPVTFKPSAKGSFEGSLVIQTEGTYSLTVTLLGRGT